MSSPLDHCEISKNEGLAVTIKSIKEGTMFNSKQDVSVEFKSPETALLFVQEFKLRRKACMDLLDALKPQVHAPEVKQETS